MRTNVHQNSIDAYHGDYMYSRTIKELITAYSLKNKRFTTQMVAGYYNRVPSTFSRWMRTLESEGVLKTELDKHTCMITGNIATYYYNPEYSTQSDMFGSKQ